MPLQRLLLCSVCTFIVLYSPQPLLPLFSELYQVSMANAGSLMTATMLPLAIAPLCYGILLSKLNPMTLLRTALCVLALTNLLFAHLNTFTALLTCRIIQGMTLPAALIAMTSHIGMSYQGSRLQKNMSLYIGSSILGGYLGRVLSANFAAFLNWQQFYYLVSLCLICLAIWIPKQARTNALSHNEDKPWQHLSILKHPAMIRLFIAVFFMFFCFTALLNFLPFIAKIHFGITDKDQIGFIYTGYLLGAVFSMSTPWLNRRFNNSWILLCVIFSLFCVSHFLLLNDNFIIFFISFTIFCGCMFIIHATAAPLANQISSAPASVTNGAYVSFYYNGGALGSFIPGIILEKYGFISFIVSLAICCFLGFVACFANYKRGTDII
jgi:YNFM family putative membrane transporter